MNFDKLLKFLHWLTFLVGLAILAFMVWKTIDTYPQKPSMNFKVPWLIINLGLFIFFLYTVNESRHYRPHLTIHHHKVHRIRTPQDLANQKHWIEIRKKAFSGDIDQMKQAIIEADKLVNTALENAGFTGETTYKKIEQILSDELGWIRGAGYKAAEYREKMHYDPDFKIYASDVKQAIQNYEIVLKELNVIDPNTF